MVYQSACRVLPGPVHLLSCDLKFMTLTVAAQLCGAMKRTSDLH